MSLDYCHKHHNYYDTDFENECSLCVDEEVEQSEQKENDKVFFIHGVRHRLYSYFFKIFLYSPFS